MTWHSRDRPMHLDRLARWLTVELDNEEKALGIEIFATRHFLRRASLEARTAAAAATEAACVSVHGPPSEVGVHPVELIAYAPPPLGEGGGGTNDVHGARPPPRGAPAEGPRPRHQKVYGQTVSFFQRAAATPNGGQIRRCSACQVQSTQGQLYCPITPAGSSGVCSHGEHGDEVFPLTITGNAALRRVAHQKGGECGGGRAAGVVDLVAHDHCRHIFGTAASEQLEFLGLLHRVLALAVSQDGNLAKTPSGPARDPDGCGPVSGLGGGLSGGSCGGLGGGSGGASLNVPLEVIFGHLATPRGLGGGRGSGGDSCGGLGGRADGSKWVGVDHGAIDLGAIRVECSEGRGAEPVQ